MNYHWVWLRVAIEAVEFFSSQGTPEWGCWAEAMVMWQTVRRPPLSLILRVKYSGSSSLLSRKLQCWKTGPWEGWWWWIFRHYRRPGPRWIWGLFSLTLPFTLLGWPLFYHLFLVFVDFSKINFFFYLSYWLRLAFLSISSQIQVQVLTGWFGSSILIFVVLMPIWTSRLWQDRILMFWILLSLKSVIAAISQSSLSLALVALNEAEEYHTWCPGYGSWCFLPAEMEPVLASASVFVTNPHKFSICIDIRILTLSALNISTHIRTLSALNISTRIRTL